MSIRSELTKPRSLERLTLGAVGMFLLAYAARQALRSLYGVSAFLAAFGATALLVSLLCTDKALRLLGTAAILLNIGAAVLALLNS